MRRPDPGRSRPLGRRAQAAGYRAQAHPDDRPHSRRSRRADDVRAGAGALLRRERAQQRADARARETISYGKISGAVGTFAHLDPEVEERVCEKLALKHAPISTQVIQRDRYAEFLSTLAIIASSMEKIALEVRHLQRTEVREAEEPFSAGQKGSSAMPHKRNPVTSEQICGLARVVRANAQAASGKHRALARAGHFALIGRAGDPAGLVHSGRLPGQQTEWLIDGLGGLSEPDAREPRIAWAA